MANDKLRGLFKEKLGKREEFINKCINEDTFLVIEIGKTWGASSFVKTSANLSREGVMINPEKKDDCLAVFFRMYGEASSFFVGHAKELEGKQWIRMSIHFPTGAVLSGKLEFEFSNTLADFGMDDEKYVLEYFKAVSEIYYAMLDQFYKKEGRFPISGEKIKPSDFKRWDKAVTVDDDGSTVEVKDIKPEDIPE